MKRLRRLVIAVIGTTVLTVGMAMIVLPGPAFVLIPVGLAILATEFAWAKTLLRKAAEKFQKEKPNLRDGRSALMPTYREYEKT